MRSGVGSDNGVLCILDAPDVVWTPMAALGHLWSLRVIAPMAEK